VRDILCALFIAIVIASCAPSVSYRTDYPLTSMFVTSRDGVLRCRIPQGWFSATDDSVGSSATILLMNENASAVLSIKEIRLDQLTTQQVKKSGLKLLAQLSADFLIENSSRAVEHIQEFQINNITFCSYEAAVSTSRLRVVVFAAKERYFECEVRGNGVDIEHQQLFIIQQALLSSLTF